MKIQSLEEMGFSGHDKTLFGKLLLPSGLSGWMVVFISLGVMAWVLISADFTGSVLEQQVNAWRALNADSDLSNYGGSAGFTLDSVFNNVATITLWMLIGLVLYLTVFGIISTIHNIKELNTNMGYINVSRGALLTSTLLRFVIRGGVLIGWFFYIKFFFGTVVLHCLSWLYDVADTQTLEHIGYAVLAFVVMAAALHVHLVFLRLLALRPRLFTGVFV